MTSIRIYPNPASKRIFLDQVPADLLKISLVTVEGRTIVEEVMSEIQTSIEVELPEVAAGIYLLILQNRDQVFSRLIRIDQE